MKRILSILMAALLLVSAIPTAFAAENETDYTAGTQITLNGSGTEQYTVTVPAKMVPGDTGTVKAEGTWASGKVLQIKTPDRVNLTYGAQSFRVDINGGKFMLPGNDVDPVAHEEDVIVLEAERLFGTWTGTLNYTVTLADFTLGKGDANGDGVIGYSDVQYLTQILNLDITLSEEELAAVKSRADMNEDNSITMSDVSALMTVLKQNIATT